MVMVMLSIEDKQYSLIKKLQQLSRALDWLLEACLACSRVADFSLGQDMLEQLLQAYPDEEVRALIAFMAPISRGDHNFCSIPCVIVARILKVKLEEVAALLKHAALYNFEKINQDLVVCLSAFIGREYQGLGQNLPRKYALSDTSPIREKKENERIVGNKTPSTQLSELRRIMDVLSSQAEDGQSKGLLKKISDKLAAKLEAARMPTGKTCDSRPVGKKVGARLF